MTPEEYTVIRDTREKDNHGWTFDYSKRGTVVNTVDAALKTGDYTIQGYEDLLCIERKATTAEIANNINQTRFKNEIIRMKDFKYSFLICEFTLDDVLSFPVNSGIPKHLWPKLKVKNYYIKRCLFEYAVKDGIQVVFAGNAGRDAAMTIFKRVLENESR